MNTFNKIEFLRAIQNSKYYHKFEKVPGLLEEIGDLLDKYSNEGFPICIGVEENFDLKYTNGNVICRIAEDGSNIKVSGKLNGTSIGIDKCGYFLKIRSKYQLMLSKTQISNSSDVRTLIEIIEKFILKNEDYKPVK